MDVALLTFASLAGAGVQPDIRIRPSHPPLVEPTPAGFIVAVVMLAALLVVSVVLAALWVRSIRRKGKYVDAWCASVFLSCTALVGSVSAAGAYDSSPFVRPTLAGLMSDLTFYLMLALALTSVGAAACWLNAAAMKQARLRYWARRATILSVTCLVTIFASAIVTNWLIRGI